MGKHLTFRLLALAAASTPALLSVLVPDESCSFFTYAIPERGMLETVVWDAVPWAVWILPVALALLPRRLLLGGVCLAALALVVTASTMVVPYTGGCGPSRGEWLPPACMAIAMIALLFARRERRPMPASADGEPPWD
jgi:hypothetical protein